MERDEATLLGIARAARFVLKFKADLDRDEEVTCPIDHNQLLCWVHFSS